MRTSLAAALALLAFAAGALVAGVAAQTASPGAAGWNWADMWDFCRRMMGA